MAKEPLSLEFTKHEDVSDSTFIHQTDNGKETFTFETAHKHCQEPYSTVARRRFG